MKKLISVILLSAMLLTACGKKDTSVETAATAATEGTSVYAEYIPQDDFGQMLIGEKISEFVDDGAVPEILTGERAETLESAVRNIRINNSRFALPMMVDSLPEGFEVEYDMSTVEVYEDTGFALYYGEVYFQKELCADASIILKEGAEEKYGIIVCLTAISNQCKWNFDGIEFSNDRDKITEKFGEPTFTTDIVNIVPFGIFLSNLGRDVKFIDYFQRTSF